VVVEPLSFALVVCGVAVGLAVLAELLHFARVLKAAPLAFGPKRTRLPLAVLAPVLRVAAIGCVAWGLAVLAAWPPKSHKANAVNDSDYRHLVLVLDVSPSMQVADAGPDGKQKRAERAADLIQSFFERVQAEQYKTTIIAVYTSAKPVVKDTTDREVVRNILTDLPMRHAYKSGETNLFAGLEMAAEVAKPWNPGSAVLLVVTDGDTVPSTGMPKMPASIGTNVVMIGVGSPSVGKSIGGHMTRQDASTLRQVATRLNGAYHDGNDKQLSTDLVSRVDERATSKKDEKLSPRELAMWLTPTGAGVLVLLPVALTLLGTGWAPGRHPREVRGRAGAPIPSAV
jgi:Ca-activated chloride channel homolog